MSELKVIQIPKMTSIFGNVIGVTEYYLKTEADAVIAEKNTKIIQLEALIENYKRISGEIIDNANHHKFRRCLAMAQEWRNYAVFCGMQSTCHNHRGFGKTAEKWTWKECHAWKCVKRWKQRAEKFQRAK